MEGCSMGTLFLHPLYPTFSPNIASLLQKSIMKKIYLVICTAALSVLSYAQQNLDFEATITPSGYPGVNDVPGWSTIFAEGESNNPGEGLQSLKITSTEDAFLASLIGYSDDTIPGFAIQSISATNLLNPGNISVDFQYKYTGVNGDIGTVIVQIADTMGAGSSDDVILYGGYLAINSDVTTWTNYTIHLIATGFSGTPNDFSIIATPSAGSIDGSSNAHPGSTLWIDAFVLNNFAYAGIEETNIQFSLYPNPMTDILNLDIESFESVKLLTFDGKEVLSSVDNHLDVSTLSAGTYICLISLKDGKTVSQKIMKW
jgi:hypothetical protein